MSPALFSNDSIVQLIGEDLNVAIQEAETNPAILDDLTPERVEEEGNASLGPTCRSTSGLNEEGNVLGSSVKAHHELNQLNQSAEMPMGCELVSMSVGRVAMGPGETGLNSKVLLEPIVIEEFECASDEEIDHEGCVRSAEQDVSIAIHSDCESERDKLKGDLRKDYYWDSEGPNNVAAEEIPNLLGRFKCESFLTNEAQNGKIWLLWKSAVSVQWLAASNQFVSVKIEENGHVYVLTIVYTKCTQLERKMLWEDLEASGCGNLPWLICGDFNIIKNDSERRGSHPRPFAAMEDFNMYIHNDSWLDMSSKSPSMTWCNGRGGLARYWVLARTTSDHSPLVIQMGDDPFRYGPGPFRFQFMWTDHSDFLRLVESVCRLEATEVIVSQLEHRIEGLEVQLQTCFSQEDDNALLKTKMDLSTWLDREDTRLAHLAKKSWLKDGDRNSKFYHAYLNAKNHAKIKEMRLVASTCLNSPFEIHKVVVDYFNNFLGVGGFRDLPNLSDLIDPVITIDENMVLCQAPSLNEIKDALFNIFIDSSPGPDGFGSGFYRVCWDLVKDDLLGAISDFFHCKSLPRFYIASFIVVIPKVDKPSGFDKFRLISLCSVIYKICTKIIVSRLTNLLSKIISQEQ
ncbi:uncharacterized protein LOC122299567 [Carya illinoinensis]|uniref:uncharacterized protein LOC122299567 n=1 Tax=Carya illinoinensis TaxID=32201 RepID=UPI001C719F75|nr:uncharacterized protein LOC122299567 [Carya illinoinensis]